MAESPFDIVIGLEVHARLLTESKIFCPCANRFGEEPNSLVCPVCLGMPGVLPVLNHRAVDLAVRAALALDGRIRPVSVFARKNYFYPDLPKGYQISQFDRPFCEGGAVPLPDGSKIELIRIHLEEDAGKLLHPEGDDGHSLVDLNRCGDPLIEIVTAPVITSPEEAYLFLVGLKEILLYAGVSDCNMEEGSLRCDANLSLRPRGETKLGTKTELKNLNSFSAVRAALRWEATRQERTLLDGKKVNHETLLWNAETKEASPMRTKEEAHDYRYFPEPDLPPLVIDPSRIDSIRATLPELPGPKRERFMKEYGVRRYDAEVLTSSAELADYYEKVAARFPDRALAAAFLTGTFLRYLSEDDTAPGLAPVGPGALARLLSLVRDETISLSAAKKVFDVLWKEGGEPAEVVDRLALRQISDEGEVEKLVVSVIDENAPQVEQFLGGKEKVFGFLVGAAMKKSGGRANPSVLGEALRAALEKRRGGRRA